MDILRQSLDEALARPGVRRAAPRAARRRCAPCRGGGVRRRARAGTQAGRRPAQLLLARDVPAAAHDRPVVRELPADGRRARVQHGGLAVAAGDRHGRADRAHARAGALRLPAGRRARRRAGSCSAATTAKAIELWRLDLASGARAARSPRRRASTSSRASRRTAGASRGCRRGQRAFRPVHRRHRRGGLANERDLVAQRKSTIDRYYYSRFDHAINPSWSPDGKRVYFVGNAEVAWGTGDLSVAGRAAANPTACKCSRGDELARAPEVGPDGKRILYSSYHGRQWHQLWLTTPGAPRRLPLTFGEFDRRNARWSPDGARIAYISNERGDTALVVQEVVGGARDAVVAAGTERLRPRGCIASRSATSTASASPRASRCSPATGARMRPTTRGCTPTTASTARSPPRRIIFTAADRLASTCRRAQAVTTCGSGFRATPCASERESRPATRPSSVELRATTSCRPSSASGSPPTCTCT